MVARTKRKDGYVVTLEVVFYLGNGENAAAALRESSCSVASLLHRLPSSANFDILPLPAPRRTLDTPTPVGLTRRILPYSTDGEMSSRDWRRRMSRAGSTSCSSRKCPEIGNCPIPRHRGHWATLSAASTVSMEILMIRISTESSREARGQSEFAKAAGEYDTQTGLQRVHILACITNLPRLQVNLSPLACKFVSSLGCQTCVPGLV